MFWFCSDFILHLPWPVTTLNDTLHNMIRAKGFTSPHFRGCSFVNKNLGCFHCFPLLVDYHYFLDCFLFLTVILVHFGKYLLLWDIAISLFSTNLLVFVVILCKSVIFLKMVSFTLWNAKGRFCKRASLQTWKHILLKRVVLTKMSSNSKFATEVKILLQHVTRYILSFFLT